VLLYCFIISLKHVEVKLESFIEKQQSPPWDMIYKRDLWEIVLLGTNRDFCDTLGCSWRVPVDSLLGVSTSKANEFRIPVTR
jgi:hypothetical protein